MPFLLDATSQITCAHGAPCKHVPSQPRVKILGIPALVATDVNTVAGCAFTLPGPVASPCVTVQWIVPAVRVKIMGQPAVLQTSTGLCKAATQAPQGPPIITVVQPRVQGL
jgi:hypothetical protein